jgi:hypothetical protein
MIFEPSTPNLKLEAETTKKNLNPSKILIENKLQGIQ